MHLAYFTEQPMSVYPEDRGLEAGHTAVLFPNRYFDPVEGSRLYQERLEEYRLVDEVGYDGIMMNEHHNAPFCMQPRITVWSSILAALTERVKIVQLGTPLPLSENPVATAEEIAMVDMISGGRLVSGIVRGGGTEHFSLNVNPAFNRERFEEAHDLIIKAFTEPGPFAWEGVHYQYRVVNPWALPLQKPHPRIWVPGVASIETIIWAAEHRYPFVALNTPWHLTQEMWKIYDEAAARVGYVSGPENRGYLLRVHVADTEEKAEANAREFMWMQGEFTGLAHPVWMSPSGYSSPRNRASLVKRANGLTPRNLAAPFERQVDGFEIIYGTPPTVIEKLRTIMEQTRPGILVLWGNDGKVSHADSLRCVELTGKEVLPAVREIGAELGLVDPFEINAPVSLAATPAEDLNPREVGPAGDAHTEEAR